MYNTVTFDVLKGKTLTKIEGMERGNDVVKFYCTDGSAYEMYHSQNCCDEDWLCSAPHGAGRIMSRAQAFKEVQMADFQKSMEGIYTTSVCEGTLDEAPQVYKPADIIRKEIGPTVEILKVIKPLWNFKAKTPEKPDWKANKHKLIRPNK